MMLRARASKEAVLLLSVGPRAGRRSMSGRKKLSRVLFRDWSNANRSRKLSTGMPETATGTFLIGNIDSFMSCYFMLHDKQRKP